MSIDHAALQRLRADLARQPLTAEQIRYARLLLERQPSKFARSIPPRQDIFMVANDSRTSAIFGRLSELGLAAAPEDCPQDVKVDITRDGDSLWCASPMLLALDERNMLAELEHRG